MTGGDGDDFPGLDPEALARAEAALAALGEAYLAWADADLAKLRAAMEPLQPKALFAIAHDIKGQAGTFGFPLVTELAHRLCRVLEGPAEPQRIALLVEALAEAITGRLDGDGGDEGRKLLARLG